MSSLEKLNILLSGIRTDIRTKKYKVTVMVLAWLDWLVI